MMATNYQRGYAFEMRVKKYLEENRLTVFRSGGSHSPADLIALSELGSVYLVQCKRDGNISVEEWNELLSVAKKNRAVAVLAYMPGEKGMEMRYLCGEAVKGERGRLDTKTKPLLFAKMINTEE